MNQTIEWKKTQAGSTEAVQFTDGMLVTAEDLGAAMRYPLSVVQVLLKAYFGCGIVCGLELSTAATAQPGPVNATANGAGARPPGCDVDYGLIIGRGVALGCDGYPIELCGPLRLDLTPDPCRLDRSAKQMFVAARRVTAAEAAARPCGCGSAADPSAQQCTRMRDHVLIQAFDEDHLPKDLCQTAAPKTGAGTQQPAGTPPQSAVTSPQPPTASPQPSAASPQGATPSLFDCLTQCGECACCGDPWVLLGSVMVGEQGLGAIDITGRRYVKPIACACAAPPTVPAAAPAQQAQSGADSTQPAAAPGSATVAAPPAAEAQPATDAPSAPAANPQAAPNA